MSWIYLTMVGLHTRSFLYVIQSEPVTVHTKTSNNSSVKSIFRFVVLYRLVEQKNTVDSACDVDNVRRKIFQKFGKWESRQDKLQTKHAQIWLTGFGCRSMGDICCRRTLPSKRIFIEIVTGGNVMGRHKSKQQASTLTCNYVCRAEIPTTPGRDKKKIRCDVEW